MSEDRLVAIVGPTASGKSALAVAAAVRLSGEIVNCDSMQMHRGLLIGTAKPSAEDRLRVPHHLYDLLEPDGVYSAGLFMKDARRICREIAARSRVPFVVGGTGLYLDALLAGVFEGPSASPELRRRLRRSARGRPMGHLHRLLRRIDPETAERLQPGDEIRIVRALEVFFLSGTPISRLQNLRTPLTGFRVLKVGIELSRPDLYDRINRRVADMFNGGLIEEVRQLLESGYPVGSKGFEALGYRHVVDLLKGRVGENEAIELTRRDSRRYAKRQLTWFRRGSGLHWLCGPGEDPAALEAFLRLYRSPQAWTQPRLADRGASD